MVTIRLKGGMGNQMFQYAFAKGLAKKLGTGVEIDCSLLLDRSRGKDHVYRNYDLTIFNVQEQFSMNPSFLQRIYKIKSSALRKYLTGKVAKRKQFIKEPHFHTDTSLLEQPKDNALYDGWWQSFKYFENVKEELKKDFSFKTPILEKSNSIYNDIQESNSVCLNVRRTDFLTNSMLNATNLDYFLRSAKKMAELVENPKFFVFSDDVEWCKQNIVLDHPVEVVSHDMKGEKFGNYMQLMISCKHFIIPNSSYAWWAVWLNENENRQVIAPKNWFSEGDLDTSDLVPNSWLRL